MNEFGAETSDSQRECAQRGAALDADGECWVCEQQADEALLEWREAHDR